MKTLFSLILLLLSCELGLAWTHTGNTFTSDGTFNDTQSAVYAASNSCIVQIPNGTFTWGDTNQRLYITSSIILQGNGTNNTVINMPYTSTDYFGNGLITMATSNITIQNFTMFATNSPATSIVVGGNNGWRITGMFFCNGNGPWAVNNNGGFGEIDHCTFFGAGGTSEMMLFYGLSNSWQTADNLGTSNQVVIENCYFYGSGYVCDANANSRVTVRFCLINGVIKVDGHGLASDSPPRGVRQMEVYGNHWTSMGQGGSWQSQEIRGGTGIFFNNAVDDNTFAGRGTVMMHEYGADTQWPNFGNLFQTPTYWPVKDQVGVGEDPKVGGSDPQYWFNNTKAGVLQSPAWAAIPTAAIAQYTNETGNVNSTYVMGTGVVGTTNAIIVEDRDFYSDMYLSGAFNGSTGVGEGTKAQMLAITGTTTNVGFWVTNEGNWNNLVQTNTSGNLYTWSGSAWVLHYTPLVYPFGSTSNMYVPPLPGPPNVNPDFVIGYKNVPFTYSPLTNDSAVSPGGYLTVVGVSNFTNCTATTDGTNITATPANNFIGLANLVYTVSDNVGYTNSALDTLFITNYPTGGGSITNPILWWQFYGNTLDSSPHGNNGLLYNTNMTYTNGYDGVPSHAALFNGNGYYYGTKIPNTVYMPPTFPLPTTTWSVSLWIKPSWVTNDSKNRSLVNFGGVYGTANSVEEVYINNGTVYAYAGNPSVYLSSGFTAPTNAWSFIAFEQDYVGDVILFTNGVQAAQASANPSYYNGNPYFYVGGHGDYDRDFAGAISDVRLFSNYAMTSQDVSNLYSAGINSPVFYPYNFQIIPTH